MRRFFVVLLACAVLLALIGCGGGSSTTTSKPTKVTIAPNPVTVDQGGVIALVATAVDANGNLTTGQPAFTFSVQNSGGGAISISSTIGTNQVLLCAGTWDAAFVNCTPGPVSSSGMVTATGGGLTSDADQVFVHVKVGRVTVTTAPVAANTCISAGGTFQLAARVFDVANNDITPTVGPLTWSTTNSTAATVDSSGLVTTAAPGNAGVFASVAGVNSLPFAIPVCPVQSITLLWNNGVGGNMSLAPNATNQTVTSVVDTNGTTISNTSLTYSLSQSTVASVSATGLVTAGPSAGTTTVVASCTPPRCGSGFSIYSNPLTLTTTGTTSTTVFAASTGSTSLVPIDTTTNAAGAAIALPNMPNSMVIAPNAGKIYLGSTAALMIVDLSNNSVTSSGSVPGKVLAISPNSGKTVIAAPNGTQVFIFDNNSNVVTNVSVAAPATAAAWSPDSTQAYILAGLNVYVFSTNVATRVVPLGAANDVSFLSSGQFAYFAGPGSAISTLRSCDNAPAAGAGGSNPLLVRSLPDGSRVIVADSPGLDVIAPTISLTSPPEVPSAACTGQSLSNAKTTVDFGLGAITPSQLIVKSDSSAVFVLLNGSSTVVRYNVGGGTQNIALANGANPTTGGNTLDGAQLYVGGTNSAVHRIDTGANVDAQQIGLSFVPDFVAVRPK